MLLMAAFVGFLMAIITIGVIILILFAKLK